MTHDDIKKIFETLVYQYAKEKKIRVAYHNVVFKPSANETYLRSTLLPSVTNSYTLSGDHVLLKGIYQVDVITDSNVGISVAESIAGELRNVFKMNEVYFKLDSKEYVQQITHLQSNQGFTTDTGFVYPLWFEYRCDVNDF